MCGYLRRPRASALYGRKRLLDHLHWALLSGFSLMGEACERDGRVLSISRGGCAVSSNDNIRGMSLAGP